MSHGKYWLMALLPGLLLLLPAWTENASAQNAVSPAPVVSNPGASSRGQSDEEVRAREEEYCRTHPGGACISDQHVVPLVRMTP
jgi:hypothetical protein